jgi:hypothetical protein
LLAKLALAKEQQAAMVAMMAKNGPVVEADDEESDVDMDEIQEEVELDDLVGDFDYEQDETEE